MIQVQNLSYSYGHGAKVLQFLTFHIQKGEKWGIMGPMGAGKTTLLMAIAGLVDFEGEININGLAWDKEGESQIRKMIGILFQNPDDQLFMPTVEEDIGFGLIQMGLPREEIQNRIDEILKKFSLENFKSRSSHHLSGGEKKLVALAAVLVMNPEILLLDEPSANLDTYYRRRMIQEIQSLEKTFLIASHDLDLLWEVTEKIILLDQGKIVEIGRAQEILSNQDLLKAHKLELPLLLQEKKGK